MDPLERRTIGKTGVRVTALGLGARGIVDPAVTVSDDEARATVTRALEAGITYVDTSPRYGLGRSERFVGQVLAGVERDQYVLSTKVGRILDPEARGGWFYDFSAEGIRRSLADSWERLGRQGADILYVHSPGDEHFDQVMAGAYPELAAMRDRGEVGAIGCGLTSWQRCLRFAQAGAWDCFLLAGRYTLLDQSALAEFLPYCVAHNIAIVIGGPYNSGILASDLGPDALYDYRVAPEAVLARARRIRDVCRAHDVPLKAAALQFVLAHPAVASVIPGSSFASHVDANFAMVAHPIPAALWDALRDEGLIDREAPVPA